MFHFLLSLFLLFHPQQTNSQPIQYVALGDSYTSGQHVQIKQRWTNLLVEDLKKNGVNIKLTNLGVGGFPTIYVTEKELPLFTHADIITLGIGINDVPFRTSVEYQHLLSDLLDKLHAKIVLLTLPNTLLSPQGKLYDDPKMIKRQIIAYNEVIKSEGKRRGIPVVDIYSVSLKATDSSYFADYLHPSPKQHLLWEKAIYPKFYALINKH